MSMEYRHSGRSPVVLAALFALCSPGFAASRLAIVQCLEAIRLVEAGVTSPEGIDSAMVLRHGHPEGPLRLSDLIGLGGPAGGRQVSV